MGHKNTPKFFFKVIEFLISFSTNIPDTFDTTDHQMTV